MFRQYDVMARIFPPYAFIFPFLEIALGTLYLLDTSMMYWLPLNSITICITLFTSIGIGRSEERRVGKEC